MRELVVGLGHLELKGLVAEASRALAHLDAERLEELALSCRALNRGLELTSLEPMSSDKRGTLARQAREARGDMAVLGRLLEVTQANMRVMNRLRELRGGPLEYSELLAPGWRQAESRHGDN